VFVYGSRGSNGDSAETATTDSGRSVKKNAIPPGNRFFYAMPDGVDGFPAKQKARNAPYRP
jgi:hypothetical protein